MIWSGQLNNAIIQMLMKIIQYIFLLLQYLFKNPLIIDNFSLLW